MIKYDQREVLIFGGSMGCYLRLAQGYLEVACDVFNNSKKDNELSMNSYMLYDALICLWYSFYVMSLSLIIMSILY